MSRSTKNSGRIGKNVRRAKRLSLSIKGLVGRATSEPWLVIPDATVIVRGVTGHYDSPNRDLLEAIVGRVVTCVMSPEMRFEATEVLTRPQFGSVSVVDIDRMLEPVWTATRWVEMAADDPKYLNFTNDADDVHILRTASGTFFHPDLSAIGKKFIVSGDLRAFRAGVNWNGFRCCSADDFMERLRDALD